MSLYPSPSPGLNDLLHTPSISSDGRRLSAPQGVQVSPDDATQEESVFRVSLHRLPMGQNMKVAEMALEGGDQVVPIPASLELEFLLGVLLPCKT